LTIQDTFDRATDPGFTFERGEQHDTSDFMNGMLNKFAGVGNYPQAMLQTLKQQQDV
jgi:hypothetical protein